jgi:hypothetical protein
MIQPPVFAPPVFAPPVFALAAGLTWLKVLLRSGDGEAGGMIDWVISGVLLIIIVSTLIVLKRVEQRRGR